MFNKIMPKLGLKQKKFDILSKQIHTLPAPQTAFVPLSAGRDENLIMTAFPGDLITPIEPLAAPEGREGSPIYSPYFGKFISMKKLKIPGIGRLPCAEIEVQNAAKEYRPREKDISGISPDEILNACMRAGIVDELDGRRLWKKLEELSSGRGRVLAVDAVEDDLYNCAGIAVLMEQGEEVAKGLRLAGKAAGAKDLFIGVYSDDEIRQKMADCYDGLPVQRFTGEYPQKYKLYQGIGANGGAAIGVQAALALYRAVAGDAVQTHMVVSVAGDCVLRPANYRVPVGTKIADLLYHAGAADDRSLLLARGYITGEEISPDAPVYLGLASVVAVRESGQKPTGPCIGCGRCVSVCPVGLMPNYILEELASGRFTKMGKDAPQCVGCGCCTIVCPSRIAVSAGVAQAGEAVQALGCVAAHSPGV